MCDYLKRNVAELYREEAQLIFKIRSRVTNVKINQRGKYDDLNCRICEEEEESQEHLFLCEGLEIENKIKDAEYLQIFIGSVEEKWKVCKLMKNRWKQMEKINP